PDQRYQTAAEMRKELQLIAEPKQQNTSRANRPGGLHGRIKTARLHFILPVILLVMAGSAWLVFTDRGRIQCLQASLVFQKSTERPLLQIENTLEVLATLYLKAGDCENARLTLAELFDDRNKNPETFTPESGHQCIQLARQYLQRKDSGNALASANMAYA